jgi:hypothetical protein
MQAESASGKMMSEDQTEERLEHEEAKNVPIGMRVTHHIIPHEEWPLTPDQDIPHKGDFVKQVNGCLTHVNFDDCTHYVSGVLGRVAYVVRVGS